MGKRKRKNRELVFSLAEKYRESSKPVCPHFGSCGGCQFQDISYDNQLELKREYINTITGPLLPDVTAVRPSPNQFAYRNRMDFVCAFGSSGLRKRGSFKEVVDLTECPLLQKKSQLIWKHLRPFLSDIEDYDYLRHTGFLRYCTLRQSYFTGETMLNFVISDEREIGTFEEIINSLGENVTSSSVLLNDTMGDSSYAPEIYTIKRGYITEKFDTVQFHIHPNTFFQANSPVALSMYQAIQQHAYGKCLDLYCGVGTISLYAAPSTQSILGVEVVPESINSAKVNARENSITNVTFTEYDARFFLKYDKNSYDTLILDPPRAGMNPKMHKYFHEFQPEKIIYMSCNPSTFITDYSFLQHYYELESFDVYDMFPQTPHLESLAILHKRGN